MKQDLELVIDSAFIVRCMTFCIQQAFLHGFVDCKINLKFKISTFPIYNFIIRINVTEVITCFANPVIVPDELKLRLIFMP
jgi:hypothetical protein